MGYVPVILFFFAAYMLFSKLWPYRFCPNYLLKSRVEHYPELMELSSQLRDKDTLQTVENVYTYMQQTYTGHVDALKTRSVLSIFKFGDFSTREILGKKQFLWCHTQNRLFKSILVNTSACKESAITIQRYFFRSFFIHQWVVVEVEGKKIKIDPYYGIFEIHSAWH